MSLKRKVYNSCVLPAMTYGCETWTLTKGSENKLRIAQRSDAGDNFKRQEEIYMDQREGQSKRHNKTSQTTKVEMGWPHSKKGL